jgi:hypothetical protein
MLSMRQACKLTSNCSIAMQVLHVEPWLHQQYFALPTVSLICLFRYETGLARQQLQMTVV